MSLCLYLEKVGSKSSEITKLHRKIVETCRSQRYSVFRNLFRSFSRNYETAGQAFRSFFRSLELKLRNDAIDAFSTVLQVTQRRALGKKKDTHCLVEEAARVCVVAGM